MKKRNLFAVLALSTLFACQSNEELGDSTVLMPTSNEKMLDLNLPSQLVASKIANNEAKKEYPNYSKSKSDLLFSSSVAKQSMLFEPALRLTRGEKDTREVKCGKEYIVAKKVTSDDGKKTFIYYKRVSIPIIILDANNQVYKGNDVKIKIHLNTKGIQDLKSGEITADENNEKKDSLLLSNFDAEHNIATNIIPQKFNKGDHIYTITYKDKKYRVLMPETIDLTEKKVDGIFVQLPFLNPTSTRWWWDNDDEEDSGDPDEDPHWGVTEDGIKTYDGYTNTVNINSFGWVDYTLNYDGTLSEYLPEPETERPENYNVMDEIPNYPTDYFFQDLPEVEVYMYQGIYDAETPPDPDLFSKVREVITLKK